MSASPWPDLARHLLGQAILAPSSHNTQPWFFRIADSTIDLHADRTRALPANDPEDRELTISCGCALMNLRVAAAGAGLGCAVQLLPAQDEPDWLARVSISREPAAAGEDAALARFIGDRRTWRKRFGRHEVPADVVGQLVAAAGIEGARLEPLTTEEVRLQAAELVARGDAVQWADPAWRRELAAWMHPRRRGDGLVVPALALPVAQVVVRTFDMGNGVAARDRELAEGSPLLAILGTTDDQPRDWLRAGQALQRVLLVACSLGLQASYLNQPVQVASLRPRLQELAGAGLPQLLLRLGYPVGELPAAPRRALDDVIRNPQ